MKKTLKVYKDKVAFAIFGGLFFIAILISRKSTNETNSRALFYNSIKENPIMFFVFIALVFVPIFFINRFLDKRGKK